MKRKPPTMEEKLASALLALGHIPYEHAKIMTASHIISLYEFDHYPIRHVDGGPNDPWNLQPIGVVQHRIKTATIDIPQIAKGKRIRGETCTGPKRKIPQRANPWPKGRTFQKRVSA